MYYAFTLVKQSEAKPNFSRFCEDINKRIHRFLVQLLEDAFRTRYRRLESTCILQNGESQLRLHSCFKYGILLSLSKFHLIRLEVWSKNISKNSPASEHANSFKTQYSSSKCQTVYRCYSASLFSPMNSLLDFRKGVRMSIRLAQFLASISIHIYFTYLKYLTNT